MATRRVGFGEEGGSPGGGWGVWLILVAAAVLIALAFAVEPGGDAAASAENWADWRAWVEARWAAMRETLGPGHAAVAAAMLMLGVTVWRRARRREARPNPPREDARTEDAPPGNPAAIARMRPFERPDEPRPARSRARVGPGAPVSSSAQKPSSGGAGGVVVAVFLMVWLIAWTAGILFISVAFFEASSESFFGPQLFMLIWIAFAVVGWVFAANMLLGMIRELFAGR